MIGTLLCKYIYLAWPFTTEQSDKVMMFFSPTTPAAVPTHVGAESLRKMKTSSYCNLMIF